MRKFTLLVLATIIFLPCLTASAAPAPTLFVYNDSTKQCGTFRDGDEYVSYTLPDGWQTYDYDKTQLKSTQQYCDDLGYSNIGSVVNYLNLKGKILRVPGSSITKKDFNYGLLVAAVIFVLVIAGVLVKIKKSRS
jgi:hypothetical protein